MVTSFVQALVAVNQIAAAANTLLTQYQAGQITQSEFLTRYQQMDLQKLAAAEDTWKEAEKAEQNKS